MNIFVSHLNQQNQIPLLYGRLSLAAIVAVMFLLIICSIRKRQPLRNNHSVNNDEFFSFGTGKALRGIAILFLILGHLSMKCIEGNLIIENAGRWAVIIFLLISGIGLTKTYVAKYSAKAFLIKRVERLLCHLWITLILFYILDFILLKQVHPYSKILSSFLGLLSVDPPNGPAWFISYIIYLYAVFSCTMLLNINQIRKFSIALLFTYLATFVIMYSPLDNHISIWKQYSLVFPVGMLLGTYHKKIHIFLEAFYRFSPALYIFILLTFILLYKNGTGFSRLYYSTDIYSLKQIIATLYPVYFIGFLVMLSYLLDIISIESRFLTFLGDYSFEIYLLHLPFMVSYDFFLFRKPLIVYFFIYFLFIIFLSYQLKKVTIILNRLLFNRLKNRKVKAA